MKAKLAPEAAAEAEPAVFPLADYMPHLLMVTARRVSRLLAHRLSESFGLTIPEWFVLVAVGHHGVLSPSMVGDLTTLDKVKVSRSAVSLVNRGLMRQSQDPHDGRGRLLRLTRKGATIRARSLPVAQELETMLAAEVSRAEWAALNRVLSRLNAFAESLEGAASGDDLD
jgi:DNA-binding MarR family transcriptional regulator